MGMKGGVAEFNGFGWDLGSFGLSFEARPT
jgi:hypothetical protein